MATKEDIHQLSAQMQVSFSDLQSSVDRYLKRTEAWHDECDVLEARFKQVVNLPRPARNHQGRRDPSWMRRRRNFGQPVIALDAKLRYAAVHLEELQATERRGSDFDRSHQEAFLFQLSGVRDAFFQECNLRHDCGLDPEKVRRNSLEEKLRASGKEAPSLETPC